MFKPVSSQVDFPSQEKTLLSHWYDSGLVNKYLQKNNNSKKKFVFLDGPITANNPMGVHHAWGRTYKDLWQRYHTMKGEAGRYQNGFDCQGLWVEVEVEKELGFKSKKDIETYGIANFVNKCKERVIKYSSIQTEQSKRLGYFMDWENSYFTMSDENNYSIWSFLKECWNRGWLYKGHDSVPWCPRCETAISQHEILTEDYKEITHDSIYIQFPILGKTSEFLLVWTTTPWTLPANIAVAVDAKISYSLVKKETGEEVWLATNLISKVFKDKPFSVLKEVKGKKLVGLKYKSPFDHLPGVSQVGSANPELFHSVVETDSRLMPITEEEGTGMVHTAVSAGEEDFKLGKKLGLPMIPVIGDDASYLPGLGDFSGKNAKRHPEIILDFLRQQDQEGSHWIFKIEPYKHRYPACWRCKAELVWKVADEWYIAMDRPDPTDERKRTFRQQMTSVTKKIKWIPGFGLDRELDWLKNMHDWLISKKNRYWGLALPIYECDKCGHFEVLGDKKELEARSVSGWERFIGNSPHRPWIDEVKINCGKCGQTVSRIKDVGNPWLDAGIVSISTLPDDWFPADFITESFPGQFKNWFYSLIAMSTVMKKTNPFKNVLGYASLLAEDGRPMHKSWGNSIEFNEGADKIGVDVMRWMYISQNPENNLLFGYKMADETRRQFHLMLWNVYNFYITYARTDNFEPSQKAFTPKCILDKWIISRLKELIIGVTDNLDKYDAYAASKFISDFINDLSLWYIRRSRDRVGPAAVSASDKNDFHNTMYLVFANLSRILAPFVPFMSDEIFTNLTGNESVHLSSWPKKEALSADEQSLVEDMRTVRKIVEVGLSKRKDAQVKVRQPLSKITINMPGQPLSADLTKLILDEMNVKSAAWGSTPELTIDLDLTITPELKAEGELRELIRQVQEARKQSGVALNQYISLGAPLPLSDELRSELQRKTLAKELYQSEAISVTALKDE
jgi:isoleucyl-tRNA synthetase